MTIFGTSAYLKLLALNPQPRDTELRKRIWPTGGNGYDFHRAMRRISTEFASGAIDWTSTKARLKAIKKPEERKSAISASFALVRWVKSRPIRLIDGAERTVSSPNDTFAVRFTPDFEIDLDGVATQVHIWNTKKPTIRIREAIGTLGLFVSKDKPRSIAILSLRTGELFLPVNYGSARELGQLLALDIERRFARLVEEYSERHSKRPDGERRASR